MPPPINVKGIKSFLGHAEFYKRFTKVFFKIARPMCNLFEKDAVFKFDEDCLQAFEELKAKLVIAYIIKLPNWSLPFEIMYDTSEYKILG